MNCQNYLEILNQKVDKMKEIVKSDFIYLKIDNIKYYWTTKALQPNYIIRINWIAWPPYTSDFKLNKYTWTSMKRKWEEENLQQWKV